ncbi:aminoacyl-tRNA hydrolase [Marinimicrobium sp. ABcell2]|uniref:aminoacyl-tRNA hydrolase n=1 Tax=Marinimicrobium sp. ABcell2 TaxID=3069751 RepID=UPI0027B1AE98|nr:aminoacyl-tRNA hydrolase [Marinimicrobium sp. ABcell2]MDQ2077635.1 aminoacyl-tRNA hydrolase [Marinimicrobium sp. ABcell2]
MDTPLQLIVGLGNPGPEYDRTRHNAGADFVAELARRNGASLSPESKFFGLTARIQIQGRDLRLLIPTTFMNRSGQAIGALAQFYKIPPEAILVAHDELDLPPGTARLKHSGGHGGHNGLRDTIKALGNNRDFNRLRLGIGHPGSASQVVVYVLKKAEPDDQRLIEDAIDRAIDVMPELTKGEWAAAMNRLHTKA